MFLWFHLIFMLVKTLRPHGVLVVSTGNEINLPSGIGFYDSMLSPRLHFARLVVGGVVPTATSDALVQREKKKETNYQISPYDSRSVLLSSHVVLMLLRVCRPPNAKLPVCTSV